MRNLYSEQGSSPISLREGINLVSRLQHLGTGPFLTYINARYNLGSVLLSMILIALVSTAPMMVGAASPTLPQVPRAQFDAKHLTSYTVSDLIGFLAGNASVSEDNQEIIEEELIRRAPIVELIEAFRKTRDATQRANLLSIMYQLDDDAVANALKKCTTEDVTAEAYYCLNYLAKRGERQALLTLNRHFGQYPVPSTQWATTIKLFGHFKIREATWNLLELVDSASLNLADAAIDSLKEMYPGAPSNFKNYEDAKEKLTLYLKREK